MRQPTVRKRGQIFILSAPSGAGKTTLARHLLASRLGLRKSVSVTTRPPRQGERAGRDYRFVTARQFDHWRRRGRFLEWARVHGACYGTLRAPVGAAIRRGQDVLLSIDVQGAAQVKRRWPKCVRIFIWPPSLEVLHERLTRRSTDSRTEIQRRLRTARGELRTAWTYDYIVINDRIAHAVKTLQAIIAAERCRTRRARP